MVYFTQPKERKYSVMEEILGTVTSLLGDLDVEALLAEIDINAIIETLKAAIETIMGMFSGLVG